MYIIKNNGNVDLPIVDNEKIFVTEGLNTLNDKLDEKDRYMLSDYLNLARYLDLNHPELQSKHSRIVDYSNEFEFCRISQKYIPNIINKPEWIKSDAVYVYDGHLSDGTRIPYYREDCRELISNSTAGLIVYIPEKSSKKNIFANVFSKLISKFQ